MKITQKLLLLPFLLLPPSILGMEPEAYLSAVLRDPSASSGQASLVPCIPSDCVAIVSREPNGAPQDERGLAQTAPLHWPVAASRILQGSYLGLLPTELRLKALEYACGIHLTDILSNWTSLIAENLEKAPCIANQDALSKISNSLSHYGKVTCNPSGTVIATTHLKSATSNDVITTIAFWNVSDGKCLAKTQITKEIAEIGFTQNGRFLVVVSQARRDPLTNAEYYNTAHFYNLETQQWCEHEFEGPGVFLLHDGNGLMYALGIEEDFLILLDPNTALPIEVPSATHTINSSRTLIATARYQSISVYEIKTGIEKCVLPIDWHQNHLMNFIDENRLVTVDTSTGNIAQWNAQDGTLITQYLIQSDPQSTCHPQKISCTGKYLIGQAKSSSFEARLSGENVHDIIAVWDTLTGHFLYHCTARENSYIEWHCSDAHFVAHNFYNHPKKIEEYRIVQSSTGTAVAHKETQCDHRIKRMPTFYLDCPDLIVVSDENGLLFWDLKSWNSQINTINLYSKECKNIRLFNYIHPLHRFVVKADNKISFFKGDIFSCIFNSLTRKTTINQVLFFIHAWKAKNQKIPFKILEHPLYQEAFNQFPDCIKQTIRAAITLITNQEELDAYFSRFAMVVPGRLSASKPIETQSGTKRKVEDA